MFLAESGSPVIFVIRGDDLNKNMSRYLVDRIEADARIDIRTSTQITALDGSRTLESVTLTGPDGDQTVQCVAVFSFIGAGRHRSGCPDALLLTSAAFCSPTGHSNSGRDDARWGELDRPPLPFETSYPGLFAVGDVRAGSTKRVAAAVGEGSAAVRSVHEYLAFAHSSRMS